MVNLSAGITGIFILFSFAFLAPRFLLGFYFYSLDQTADQTLSADSDAYTGNKTVLYLHTCDVCHKDRCSEQSDIYVYHREQQFHVSDRLHTAPPRFRSSSGRCVIAAALLRQYSGVSMIPA